MPVSFGHFPGTSFMRSTKSKKEYDKNDWMRNCKHSTEQREKFDKNYLCPNFFTTIISICNPSKYV